VFTDGAKTATHDADGYTAINGTSNFAYYRADVANLVTSSNEGSFRADRLELTQTSGDVSAILSVNSGSGTLTVVNSNGGKGTYQATLAKLEDSLGDSTLTTQSLHINSSGGGYATFNGSGWLELRNAAGKEIYLDPTQIVFTDGAKTATHDADGYTAINGTSNFAYYRADVANLVTSSNEGSFRADRLVISQTSGSNSATLFSTELSVISGSSEARIYAGGATVSNSSSSVQITPPGENAYFQSIDYIDSNFDVQSVKVLATAPIPSGVFDPCQKVVTCVTDSEIFPTWTETNANYVDWSSFSQVPAYIESKIINALLGLGVDATCDSSGNITVTLTGLPSTSSNTPNWPSAPGTLT
jgi:hypothetical protein